MVTQNNLNNEITVAVLPFRMLSNREELSPIPMALTEDLIINFSKFLGLSVISQYSTQHINDLSDDEAIAKLGADYLVKGSLRTMDDIIRIGIQLIRYKDRKVVFAANYEESLDSIFSTQDQIIQQIVSALQQQIDYDLLSYSYKKDRVELAAYENWLIGMAALKKGSPEQDLIARRYFESALKIDPNYARAYTGISLSYYNEWSCQLWDRWDVSKKGAHKYALKALELDENDYISLSVLGRTYLFASEFEKAEHCLRKSLRMNPSDAGNLIQVAFSLMYLGYPEESIKLYHKAIDLNPFHKSIYFAYGSNFYFECGQFEKSIELGKKVELHSAWLDFPVYLAAAHYHLNQSDLMLKNWQEFLRSFKKKIATGKEQLEQEALSWHINVNPYQNKTFLKPFWKHISDSSHFSYAEIYHPLPKLENPSFIRKGEMWEIKFKGKTVLLKDAKGFRDIANLLANPNQDIHCNELMGSTLEAIGSKLIDQQAKQEYQKRINELQEEIRSAEEMNDLSSLPKLNEEYDRLLEHLSNALGLAGKIREKGSSVEKARSAVTWRIRSTVKRIEKAHPELAKHLNTSIKTGTLCAYRPELDVKWKI